jgi:hypothetical protein
MQNQTPETPENTCQNCEGLKKTVSLYGDALHYTVKLLHHAIGPSITNEERMKIKVAFEEISKSLDSQESTKEE